MLIYTKYSCSEQYKGKNMRYNSTKWLAEPIGRSIQCPTKNQAGSFNSKINAATATGRKNKSAPQTRGLGARCLSGPLPSHYHIPSITIFYRPVRPPSLGRPRWAALAFCRAAGGFCIEKSQSDTPCKLAEELGEC